MLGMNGLLHHSWKYLPSLFNRWLMMDQVEGKQKLKCLAKEMKHPKTIFAQ